MKTLLIATFMMVAAAPALANEAAATDGVQANATATAKPKKICRTSDVPTGSIIPPRRTCKTAEEWVAVDAANAAANTRANTVAPPQVSLDALTPHF